MDEFSNIFGNKLEDAKSKDEAVFKGDTYRITVLTERLVRLEYSSEGNFEDRTTELARFRNFDVPRFEVEENERQLKISTSYFELNYVKERPFEGSKLNPDQNLIIKLIGTDRFWYYNHPEARNYGSNTVSLDNATSMPSIEKGLYSTDGFVALYDDNSLIFDTNGSVGKRTDKRIDVYVFMYRTDFGYCLRDYYMLTGYPPLIPRYALGIWWEKDTRYTEDNILDLMGNFKRNQIPISVLMLKNWSVDGQNFDNKLISNPSNIINKLNDLDVHVGVDLDLQPLKKKNEEGKDELIVFNVFSKDYISKYLSSIIDPLINCGVESLKLNFNTKDLYSLRMINYYFYKYLSYKSDKRGLILSRNGLINAHLYPVCDSGETFVNWKTLKMLPLFTSTSSNKGVSWWSHAIGGYKEGIEDSLLYVRFVQYGTYSPIFRFSSKAGHYYKREPWRWDVKTLKIVKDYTTIRQRLIPYLYSEAFKYSKTGLPIIQPIYYTYPDIYDEPKYKSEYYFGSELFVVPITDTKDDVMNRTVVKMFLPSGIWYDFKTGKKFPGGRQLTFFRDEDYPVFAKQGGIIPLADLKDNINDSSNPDSFTIHVFPGKNNTYKLYEDDGKKGNANTLNSLTTLIEYNYLPNNYTVIIRKLEGDSSVIPEKRKYKIKFRNTRLADDVIAYVGDQRIEVKSYKEEQDFIVEVPYVDSTKQLSINCKGKDIEIDAVHIINEDIDTIISDLKITTTLKEKIASILFSDDEIKKKRIAIRKLKRNGLSEIFIKMFLKLLEYIAEI